MSLHSRLSGSVCIVLCLVFATVLPARGYEIPTHQAISIKAADISNVDNFLKTSIGIPEGLRSEFNGFSLIRWIAEGAAREDLNLDLSDRSVARYRNHFHDPRLSWGAAGLSSIFPFVFESSIIWGQDQNQGWSWPKARQFYKDALTSPTKAVRDQGLANTFRALGQLIHLVQDAASPGHTRNDAHALYNYESFVDAVRIQEATAFLGFMSSPMGPITGWELQGSHDPAPVAIARLIDTERYHDTTVPPAGLNSGLAEYTNANFFSEDTIFSQDFVYPNELSVVERESTIFLKGNAVKRRYYEKVGDGDTGYRLATVGFLIDYLHFYGIDITRYFQKPALDEVVYRDYATRLVPRAVGYSTALLDYFFRGKLKGVLQHVEGPVSAFSSPPYNVEFILTNESTEEMQGDFTLYFDDSSGTRTQLIQWTQQTLAPGATQTFAPFVVPNGFPAVKQFFIVFQGRLGTEQGAVAGNLVGPPDFLEQWDNGFTGNHPWAHLPDPAHPELGTNPSNGTSTNAVTSGHLIKTNTRNADNVNNDPSTWGKPRFNESFLGAMVVNGQVVRSFQDALPMPISSRTVVQVKIDDMSINAQPPCQPNTTCAFQYIQFNFTNGRFIQVTVQGQQGTFGGNGVTLAATLGTRLKFNIYDELTRGNVPVDNLVLGEIVIHQQIMPYFDPNISHPPVLSHYDADPMTRTQRMDIDYIWLSDLDTDKDTDGDGMPDVFEVTYGLDPLNSNDASGDADNDGLTNLAEYQAGSNPLMADSNGDGVRDGDAGGDPLAVETTPPTASITQPVTGSTVNAGQTITLSATAQDNVGVAMVLFSVNGTTFNATPSAPYTAQYTVPFGVTQLTIRTIAIDVNGNVGEATPVVINVITDHPVVTVTAPAAGATFIEGQTITLIATAQGNAAIAFTELTVNGVRVGFSTGPFPAVAQYTIPLGVTLLTIGANAIDVNGAVGSAAPIVINVIPDPPPTVLITSPPIGTTVFEGSPLTLVAIATDNVLVTNVFWSVNGTAKPPIFSPPYQMEITVPIGITSLTIQATATDNRGQRSTATRTITILPDPGTTVVGRIVDSNRRPFAGATITIFGQFTAQSQAAGTFSIPGVPAIRGGITAVARGFQGATALRGFSATFSPVTAGVTDIGDISVYTMGLELYPGQKMVRVGNFPLLAGVADLNGDGFPDLVTTNAEPDYISILLGNGDGTFQNQRRLIRGYSSEQGAVADLNGDGVPDLVVVTGSLNISVLLGNGDATFQPELSFSLGRGVSSLAMADLNGDGKPDIVVATGSPNGVSVFLGNGDGTFQTELRVAETNFIASIAVADLNGDGFLDIATTNLFSNNISVFLGNGDGTFQAQQDFAVGDGPVGIAIADLNGDGFADVVTTNGSSDDVSILLGNGNGTFPTQQRFAVGNFPLSVTVANLNGDGFRDLVVANASSNDVSVLLGNGNGTFQPQQRFATDNFPESVSVADLNRDGFLDIVTANSNSSDISVLLGNGDGIFKTRPKALRFAVGGEPFSAAVVDLNGDGFPDIVTANSNGASNDVSVLLANGDGTFRPQQRFAAGNFPSSVAVADLNGDGKPDIVTANSESNDISVLLGNGDGTFQTQQLFAAGDYPESVSVADLNGDGKPDIVTANGDSNDVSVLLGNGDGTFQTQQRFGAGGFPVSVAVADLNGDGAPDIVTANLGSNDVSVLLGNGDGTFTLLQRFAAGDFPSSVAVADLNGDGKLDIVTANTGSDDVSVLLGNGDGTFQNEHAFNVDFGSAPFFVTVADLNGDGIPDLAVANFSSSDVSVHLGNGDGTFQNPLFYATGWRAVWVTIGDVDGDGKPDLITVNNWDNDVSVLLHE
jgi:hypothetical protein